MIEAVRATRMPCGGNCTRDRRPTHQEFRHGVAGGCPLEKMRTPSSGGLRWPAG
jgi:hypothetical protein